MAIFTATAAIEIAQWLFSRQRHHIRYLDFSYHRLFVPWTIRTTAWFRASWCIHCKKVCTSNDVNSWQYRLNIKACCGQLCSTYTSWHLFWRRRSSWRCRSFCLSKLSEQCLWKQWRCRHKAIDGWLHDLWNSWHAGINLMKLPESSITHVVTIVWLLRWVDGSLRWRWIRSKLARL